MSRSLAFASLPGNRATQELLRRRKPCAVDIARSIAIAISASILIVITRVAAMRPSRLRATGFRRRFFALWAGWLR